MTKPQGPYEYIKGCLEDWVISQGENIEKDSAHIVRETSDEVLEGSNNAEQLYVLGWERCDYRDDISLAMGELHGRYSMLFYKGFLTSFVNGWKEGYESGVYFLSIRPSMIFKSDDLVSLGDYLKERGVVLAHKEGEVRISYKCP